MYRGVSTPMFLWLQTGLNQIKPLCLSLLKATRRAENFFIHKLSFSHQVACFDFQALQLNLKMLKLRDSIQLKGA